MALHPTKKIETRERELERDDVLPERLELGDAAFEAFSEKIMNPPVPSDALVAAFAAFKAKR